MPSRICCPQNHSTRTISAYEAAMALAEGRPIGACKKCGMDLQYQIECAFGGAASEKERSFVVARAVRLGPRRPEGGQCDSFLLVLQDVETGKQRILPTHWFEGQANTQRGGHVAPLLTMADWTRLFSQLGVTLQGIEERIRTRAYQLYEQRGNRGGSAVEDWLQAESEIMEPQELRVAA
jgi:Protein of unknown function (DUF2934)